MTAATLAPAFVFHFPPPHPRSREKRVCLVVCLVGAGMLDALRTHRDRLQSHPKKRSSGKTTAGRVPVKENAACQIETGWAVLDSNQ